MTLYHKEFESGEKLLIFKTELSNSAKILQNKRKLALVGKFGNCGWGTRIVIPNTSCRAPFTTLTLRYEPNNFVVPPNTESAQPKIKTP
jgi:hypothetical protein